MLVNPCEPGQMFLTLKSAPTDRDDGPTQGKGEKVYVGYMLV